MVMSMVPSRVAFGVGASIRAGPRPHGRSSVPQSAPSTLPRPRNRRPVSCQAKKKNKGGKKGKAKKVSALDAVLKKKPTSGEQEEGKATSAGQHTSVDVVMWLLLVVESYTKAVGKKLFAEQFSIQDIAEKIYDAPFVLLSHRYGEEGEAVREHTFNYANRRALELFDCEWADLVGKPSSSSGEDDEAVQSDRDALLMACKKEGFVENYEGWRVSSKGERFLVKGATLWEVKTSSGDASLGQAVVFTEWEDAEGNTRSVAEEGGAVDGDGDEEAGEVVDLAEAERLVQEQADLVRGLKANLTNEDAEVKEAVTVLLERKAALEALQQAS